MFYIGKIVKNIKSFYNEINPATLSGAIDIIVVEQPDGSFKCSPFYIRFGKLGVFKSREKEVDIEVNGNLITTIKMKLDGFGRAYFVNEDEEEEEDLFVLSEESKVEGTISSNNSEQSCIIDTDYASDSELDDLKNNFEHGMQSAFSDPDLRNCHNQTSPINRRKSSKDLSNKQDQRESTSKSKKFISLSSEKIISLGLSSGKNEASFTVVTMYQGTIIAKCNIYLWKHSDSIVISDIDGTITRTDVRGHIMPYIGRDWTHHGVASLFQKLSKNGYKIIYLSSRGIGQSRQTKDYLESISQNEFFLPDGPLLLNPTSLIRAFHKEVIVKKPEEFKIDCLKKIKVLFPNRNPFYAGFGNRINDIYAYSEVEICQTRIFIINRKSEVRIAFTYAFQSNYKDLMELVDHIFPAINKQQIESNSNSEDKKIDGYSTFEFWRDPIPEFQKI